MIISIHVTLYVLRSYNIHHPEVYLSTYITDIVISNDIELQFEIVKFTCDIFILHAWSQSKPCVKSTLQV